MAACAQLQLQCGAPTSESVFASSRGSTQKYDNAPRESTFVLGGIAWRNAGQDVLVESFPGENAARSAPGFLKRVPFLPWAGILRIASAVFGGLILFAIAKHFTGCVTRRPIFVYSCVLFFGGVAFLQAGLLASLPFYAMCLISLVLYALAFILYWTRVPGRVDYVSLPVTALVVLVTVAMTIRLVQSLLLGDLARVVEFLYGSLDRPETGLHVIIPLTLVGGAILALVPGFASRAVTHARTDRHLLEAAVKRPLDIRTAYQHVQVSPDVRISLLRRGMAARRRERRRQVGRAKELAEWIRGHRRAWRKLRGKRERRAPNAHEAACAEMLVDYDRTLRRAKEKLPFV